ncbi:hypothetical protein F4604DRAFT_1924742 [Suillus subluteus]|nr:hypothetical protein F4604DRAFT_1924742 [Suillus subluteus]
MSLILPEYLNNIIIMLMSWQVGMLDDEDLFIKFSDYKVNMLSESHLLASYQIILVHQYSWWKDQFDVISFEMLHCISLDKLIELYWEHAKQLMTIWTFAVHTGSHMQARNDLQQFRMKLEEWLLEKIGDGNHALNQMTSLYGPAEHLYDAMMVSQELLDAEE